MKKEKGEDEKSHPFFNLYSNLLMHRLEGTPLNSFFSHVTETKPPETPSSPPYPPLPRPSFSAHERRKGEREKGILIGIFSIIVPNPPLGRHEAPEKRGKGKEGKVTLFPFRFGF